jgi:hypothetical protein
MNDSQLYTFSELSGSLHKFAYNLGIGISRDYFKEGAQTYTFYDYRHGLLPIHPKFFGSYA